MRRVLVSHPHAAEVANRTAAALEAEGLLSRYVTGLAAAEQGTAGRIFGRLARARPVLENRLVRGVASSRLRSRGAVELLARAAGRARGGPAEVYDALFVLHDAAVALAPWPADLDAVLAYEDSAHLTFLRAARRGLVRVLDLPAPAARAVDETLRREHARWPDAEIAPRIEEPTWKRRRKAAELALADVVLVASTFTASTLAREGRAAVLVPYGFPVETFPSKHEYPASLAPEGPVTVLAVGALSVRKGTPYLLEAWRRARLPGARLVLVGRLALAPAFLARYAGMFEHVASVPRALMGAYYRGADLLVFPAVADGFGLAILEAMASGTPVLATRASGGPDCIADGDDGLLVPAHDVDALVEALRAAVGDRARLEAMGRRARARAETRPWSVAGRALAARLEAWPTPGETR